MSELHDMAKDLGVAMWENKGPHDDCECTCDRPRSDTDIAHDCLAGLSGNCGLTFWPKKQQWCADWSDGTMDGDDLVAVGTFIECVIALWKRQKAST